MSNNNIKVYFAISPIIIGSTRLQMETITPDPICLRTNFSLVFSFFDFITEHHFFLFPRMEALTFSNNLRSSILLTNPSLFIKLYTISSINCIERLLVFRIKKSRSFLSRFLKILKTVNISFSLDLFIFTPKFRNYNIFELLI
jgi:hypothetical protein